MYYVIVEYRGKEIKRIEAASKYAAKKQAQRIEENNYEYDVKVEVANVAPTPNDKSICV